MVHTSLHGRLGALAISHSTRQTERERERKRERERERCLLSLYVIAWGLRLQPDKGKGRHIDQSARHSTRAERAARSFGIALARRERILLPQTQRHRSRITIHHCKPLPLAAKATLASSRTYLANPLACTTPARSQCGGSIQPRRQPIASRRPQSALGQRVISLFWGHKESLRAQRVFRRLNNEPKLPTLRH